MNSANKLFSPKSVAVVGVSTDTSKLGSVIFHNIISGNFQGELYPVNPKYKEILGYECKPNLSAIEGDIDLAIIVIPAKYVFDAVRDCVKKGVSHAIIISAGFSEIGKEGKQLEDEISTYARKNNLRIVGPNCLGVISTAGNLNASFAAQNPTHGNVAFLSQSGAFNTALLDIADSKSFGFKYFVSLGNKSDIDEIDLIEEWLNDDTVKVIGAYLEEFEDGRRLLEVLERNPRKPLIVLHSGQSDEGKKAAASHTGSIANSSSTVRIALKQAGAIQVDSIEKMFSNLMMFSWAPHPKQDRVAIITNAGGPGIMVTDMISNAGMKLAKLSEETQADLYEVLPNTASVLNPVDVLGDALSIRYRDAIDIVDKDPGVDSIVVLLTPQLVTQIEDTARLVIDFEKRTEKPVIPIFVGDRYAMAGLDRLWANRIPAYQYAEEAVDSLKNLTNYDPRSKKILATRTSGKAEHVEDFYYNIEKGNEALPQTLVTRMCKEVGLEIPSEKVVTNYEMALEFATEKGFPVVIKATNEDIAHKTEQKLVHLDIKTKEDLKRSIEELSQTISTITKSEKPQMLIQEMIKGEEELILGITKGEDEKGFGDLLLFGKGGIYAEVFNDTSTRIASITEQEIEKMISETNVSKIIDGVRGKPPLARSQLVKQIMALQKLVELYPQIRSIDINPCMITENKAVSVDVKIFI
jgi:acetyltransferase